MTDYKTRCTIMPSGKSDKDDYGDNGYYYWKNKLKQKTFDLINIDATAGPYLSGYSNYTSSDFKSSQTQFEVIRPIVEDVIRKYPKARVIFRLNGINKNIVKWLNKYIETKKHARYYRPYFCWQNNSTMLISFINEPTGLSRKYKLFKNILFTW